MEYAENFRPSAWCILSAKHCRGVRFMMELLKDAVENKEPLN
jgi:hypothetical protein